MKKSFYQYVMKYRQPKAVDDYSAFAEDLFKDHLFPKHSGSYEEISRYLEENALSLNAVQVFDDLWRLYEEEEV
ncbi:YozE family protein [Bacillaceae bacterium SIJ1]|nr:YozE family protein [Litoribacterium kuwaitense]